MKFLCPKVLVIFSFSAVIAVILWFFIVSQVVVDHAELLRDTKKKSDVSVQNMVLYIDDAIVYADEVLGDKTNKNIQLLGKAKVLWKEFEFLGTNFWYEKDKNLMSTIDPIVITMPHIVTSANAMKIDTKQQNIELQGNICTIFDKK